MSFIAALDTELEALHSLLAGDPTFVKWRELQRIRGLYSQDSADMVLSGPSGTTVVQAKPMPVQQAPSRGEGDAGTRGRRPDPSRSRAVQEAETIIRAANGNPVPTSDILEQLQEQGISVPGERPLNYLSAMLSNSGLFAANGRRGWTLKAERSVIDDAEVDVSSPESSEVMDFNEEAETIPNLSFEDSVRTIAHYVAQTLDPETRSEVRRSTSHGKPLLEEIEIKLEEIARKSLHRDVDEIEMSAIRSEFIKSLFHRERKEVHSESASRAS